MRGVVGQNRDRFLLHASAIANFEGGGDFALFARTGTLLGGSSRAAARGGHRLNRDRFVSLILIFEMADRRVVSNSGMQFDLSLFPSEFGMRRGSKASDDGNDKNLDPSVHSRRKRLTDFLSTATTGLMVWASRSTSLSASEILFLSAQRVFPLYPIQRFLARP